MSSDALPSAFAEDLRPPEVQAEVVPDDGTDPNHDQLPVLVSRDALRARVASPADAFERISRAHGWTGAWRDGIFSSHHYHSTPQQVLGVARGRAPVQLGGPTGPTLEVGGGDVLVLPAGRGRTRRRARTRPSGASVPARRADGET